MISRAARLSAALTVLLTAACGGGAPGTAPAGPASVPQADREASAGEVAAVLDDWHDAAAQADFERYFGHFAEDGIFLGTDATERWTVAEFRDYARPHFEAGRAWTFRATRREVIFASDGGLAWFDEDLETENLGPARGSGVLVRSAGGRWRIAHYNLTVTVPNERFREVRELLEAEAAPTPDDPTPDPTGAPEAAD